MYAEWVELSNQNRTLNSFLTRIVLGLKLGLVKWYDNKEIARDMYNCLLKRHV